MEPLAIWSDFLSLQELKVEQTRRHRLIGIVIISVLVVVTGADGWSDVFPFAEDPQVWFKAFLELPAGILCDAFRCVSKLNIFLSMPQAVVERTLLPGLARVRAL